jgi:hypothetical protein
MFERVTDSYEFPADLAGIGESGGEALRWTAWTIAGATALLALLNAHSLRGWVEDMPPGPVTMRLAAAASGWEDATARIGLGTPHARLHRAWLRMEQARWSPQPAVVEEARR